MGLLAKLVALPPELDTRYGDFPLTVGGILRFGREWQHTCVTSIDQ